MAAAVSVELACPGIKRPVEHRFPIQLQAEAGVEVHVQADRCTHNQGLRAVQGRDRALARRVQNQDLVQGLV